MIRITKLREDRWKDFKELRLEALRQDPAAFGSSFEDEEKFKRDVWIARIPNAYFAIFEGKPVGMITCLFNERRKTRHCADIFAVYVTPSFRGRGIGRMLLERALQEARRRKGVIKVKLAVNPKQKIAVRIYKKAGFRIVGRSRKELRVGGKYFGMLYMEKFLS